MKNLPTQAAFAFSRYLLLLIFLSFDALSADDNVFLGNGHSGSSTVSVANIVVNVYSGLTANAPAGQNFVTISNTTGFASGDLVMVWQTAQSTSENTSTASAATDLTSQPVGRWEFARITGLTATKLTFSSTLKFAYSSPGAQAIKVPEYTSVTINAAGSIVASPWDGTSGGIVVFLATGTVTNNGTVSSVGRGFRGGIFSNDGGATTGGSALDLLPPTAGRKGEGVTINRFGATYGGRGTFANAGGGGSGFKSGGGGGGSVGAGGNGGNSDLASDANRSVGGYGGGALIYDPVFRLVMGGGGGAGHGSSSSGAAGGAGGGIVFFRANALSGTGTISANGANAATVNSDAGSGGGAAGGVYVRVAGNAACNLISATGGNGGSVSDSEIGPGGGGGGGKILFQAAGGSCSNWTVAGGDAGSQGNPLAPGGSAYGATNGAVGSATTLLGGMTVPIVAITTPAPAAVTSDKPSITGTATPNSTVRLIVDGTEINAVPVDLNGEYTYQLTGSQALTDGPHILKAVAEYQGLISSEAQISFTTEAVLPVKIISFTSLLELKTVHLNWEVTSEVGVEKYAVERSSDGRHFAEIISVAATAENLQRATYTAKDDAPRHGENLYRLKMVDRDGSIAYSRIVGQHVDQGISVVLFPNPTNGNATLSLDGLQKNGVTVSVINARGIPVRSYLVAPGSSHEQLLIERKQLPPGIYHVNVHYATGEKLSGTKLVVY